MANKQIDASSGVPPPVKGSQGDAPPPYSGPSGSSAPPPVALPYPVGVDLQPQPDHNGWTPPPNLSVAKSRALRRFWVAFFWAWGIWILIGLFIGGGVSDVKSNPVGRHGHYGKHGQWHDDGFPERQRMGWHKKESHAGSPEEAARVEIVEDMVVEVPT